MGLEARDQQQPTHRPQLLGPDPVALHRDQVADQVVARLDPPQLEERREQGVQLGVGPHQLAGMAQRPDAAEGAADRGAVAGERRGVGVGDAEELGDHRDRQRGGVRRHEVDVATVHDVVQETVDDLLDPPAVVRHAAWAEGAGGETTEPGVVRRVPVEEGQVDVVSRPGHVPFGLHAEASAAEHGAAGRVVHGRQVAEPGRDPPTLRPPDLLVDGIGVDSARPPAQPGERVAPRAVDRDPEPVAVQRPGEAGRCPHLVGPRRHAATLVRLSRDPRRDA